MNGRRLNFNNIMISHELKCIFIHIPRTGGSIIEKLLVGQDWWIFDKKTKHLIASQAKKLYSEYWNDYFKFSFVRDPYSRMLSLTTFDIIRKISLEAKILINKIYDEDFSTYAYKRT